MRGPQSTRLEAKGIEDTVGDLRQVASRDRRASGREYLRSGESQSVHVLPRRESGPPNACFKDEVAASRGRDWVGICGT
jgi:hypothetical protein